MQVEPVWAVLLIYRLQLFTTQCSQDQLYEVPLPILFSSSSKTAWTSPQSTGVSSCSGSIPVLINCQRGIGMSQIYVRNCSNNSQQYLSDHQSIRLMATCGTMRKSKILNKWLWRKCCPPHLANIAFLCYPSKLALQIFPLLSFLSCWVDMWDKILVHYWSKSVRCLINPPACLLYLLWHFKLLLQTLCKGSFHLIFYSVKSSQNPTPARTACNK